MDDVVLTFHCALVDADVIAQTLRTESGKPVHVREEVVHGRDFSDAKVSEQVTGTLTRAAVEVLVPRARVDALVAGVGSARRSLPVRWNAVPVAVSGRIA